MQVQSLGWEDPLEKEMVTPSSVLAWRILWTDEPGGLQSMQSPTPSTHPRFIIHIAKNKKLLTTILVKCKSDCYSLYKITLLPTGWIPNL